MGVQIHKGHETQSIRAIRPQASRKLSLFLLLRSVTCTPDYHGLKFTGAHGEGGELGLVADREVGPSTYSLCGPFVYVGCWPCLGAVVLCAQFQPQKQRTCTGAGCPLSPHVEVPHTAMQTTRNNSPS